MLYRSSFTYTKVLSFETDMASVRDFAIRQLERTDPSGRSYSANNNFLYEIYLQTACKLRRIR